MKNKKILITTGGLSSVGQTGGVSSYVHDLATNLQNADFDVIVYLIKENNLNEPSNVNYNYRLYDITPTYRGEELLIKKILADINALKPNVIINNGTSYLAGLWPVLDTNIIKISVMHGFTKGYSLDNSGIIGKMATLNLQYIDYLVCQNSTMVKDVIKKYKVPAYKVKHVPQSFTKDDSKVSSINNEYLNIIFANGLNKSKGADVMMKVADLLKQSDMNFIVRWCKINHIPSFEGDNRFIFYGDLTRDDFVDKVRESDIIIIPTKLDTGPMLLVEAMANGVVPLCNNLQESAIPDIIENNKNGYFIDENHPERYFQILKELHNNRTLLNQLKLNARNYYLNNLTEEHQVGRYEALFRKQENEESVPLSNKNIVFYHLKSRAKLSRFSIKRIYLKIRDTLELPLFK